MNRIDPNNIQIHFGLPPATMPYEFTAIDSEFFNQEKEKLHRPHGDFACVGCTSNGYDVYLITDQNDISEFYRRIDASTHIYHNAFYDFCQLRRFSDELPDRKKLWDTMLVEKIRFSGYYDSFALNDLARRYLDVYMDKSERETFSSSDGKMTDEQILYSSIDIVCTYWIGKIQMEQIDADDLSIWKNIERPFLWVLLDMPGTKLDQEKWTIRYENDLG